MFQKNKNLLFAAQCIMYTILVLIACGAAVSGVICMAYVSIKLGIITIIMGLVVFAVLFSFWFCLVFGFVYLSF